MAMANLAFKIAEPDPNRALHIMALNGLYDEMDALGVLKHAVSDVLKDDIAIVSSFGADSAVLLHLVSLVDKALPVYFLETGKHFPETLQYVETLKSHLGLTNVRWLRPDPKDIARFDPHVGPGLGDPGALGVRGDVLHRQFRDPAGGGRDCQERDCR